jgi:hypothetical protein
MAVQAPGSAKYVRFTVDLWYQAPGCSEVLLTFAQIEQLLGQDLPPTARRRPQWWAKDHTTHVQAHAWLDAGWAAFPVISEERVDFRRSNG